MRGPSKRPCLVCRALPLCFPGTLLVRLGLHDISRMVGDPLEGVDNIDVNKLGVNSGLVIDHAIDRSFPKRLAVVINLFF